MKSRLVPFLFAAVCVWIVLNRGEWRAGRILNWDSGGYYVYLPATFIYGDLRQLSFLQDVRVRYGNDRDNPYCGVFTDSATQNAFTKYPVGTALFEAPFFLIAHGYTKAFSAYSPDGWGPPYQLAVCLATIFWSAAGLWILRKVLLKFFKDRIVFFVLSLIGFGTNLYHFTAFNPGWSHPYSFFLLAAGLWCTIALWKDEREKYLPLLGLLLGLCVVTRPTNALMGLIPLLWLLSSRRSRVFLTALFTGKSPLVPVALLLFLLPLFLQMAYWKYTSGSWVFYSYGEEGFDFLHPHIWKGLFSYEKGWFIYTPMALLCITGLVPALRQRRIFAVPASIYLLLHIYIVLSWREWTYGGGFTMRPMIDVLPALALPLGVLLEQLTNLRSLFVKMACATALIFLLFLNIFQTYQYSNGIIIYANMNRAYYWRVFCRLGATPKDRALLSNDSR